MGNQCNTLCMNAQSKIFDDGIDLQLVQHANKERISSILKSFQRIDHFPETIPLQINLVIEKHGKKSNGKEEVWEFTKPFHGYLLRQSTHNQETDPKTVQNINIFAKIFKLNDKDHIVHYYEGFLQDAEANDQQGLSVYQNGSFFIGNIKKSEKYFGKFVSKNKEYSYEGKWVNDLPNGQGTQITSQYQYIGRFEDGKKNGNGKLHSTNKRCIYEGQFRNNLFEGEGALTVVGDLSYNYSGHFEAGKFEGQGKWISSEQQYEGGFVKGKKEGKGVLKYKSDVYSGDFKDGVPHGKGELTSSQTNASISGVWHHGKFIHVAKPVQ